MTLTGQRPAKMLTFLEWRVLYRAVYDAPRDKVCPNPQGRSYLIY